ncbi:hypothetical protein DFH06DRAFT_1024991, partial [Mycena polygramma]
VQLLWINIIMNMLTALALATDPASESLLNRKPDKILGFTNSTDANTVKKNDLIVQTLVFNASVFAQIFHSIECRRLDQKITLIGMSFFPASLSLP